MLAADGLVVFAGSYVSTKVPMPSMRLVAAGLFFVFGVLAILRSLDTRSLVRWQDRTRGHGDGSYLRRDLTGGALFLLFRGLTLGSSDILSVMPVVMPATACDPPKTALRQPTGERNTPRQICDLPRGVESGQSM